MVLKQFLVNKLLAFVSNQFRKFTVLSFRKNYELEQATTLFLFGLRIV